jgi:hypothetical protein
MVVWCGVIIISSNPRSSFYNKVEKSLNSSTKGTLNTLHTANQHNTTQHNTTEKHNTTHTFQFRTYVFFIVSQVSQVSPQNQIVKKSPLKISQPQERKKSASLLRCGVTQVTHSNLANWIFQYSNIYRYIKYILI